MSLAWPLVVLVLGLATLGLSAAVLLEVKARRRHDTEELLGVLKRLDALNTSVADLAPRISKLELKGLGRTGT